MKHMLLRMSTMNDSNEGGVQDKGLGYPHVLLRPFSIHQILVSPPPASYIQQAADCF